MSLVVDASAMVEFILGSFKGVQVRTLVQAHGASVHAPDLILGESLSALRSLERHAEITTDRANEAVADLRSVPFLPYSTAHLAARIWTLRGRFTVYDAHYVALAEALSAPLITGDRRLATAAADVIEVHTV